MNSLKRNIVILTGSILVSFLKKSNISIFSRIIIK